MGPEAPSGHQCTTSAQPLLGKQQDLKSLPSTSPQPLVPNCKALMSLWHEQGNPENLAVTICQLQGHSQGPTCHRDFRGTAKYKSLKYPQPFHPAEHHRGGIYEANGTDVDNHASKSHLLFSRTRKGSQASSVPDSIHGTCGLTSNVAWQSPAPLGHHWVWSEQSHSYRI